VNLGIIITPMLDMSFQLMAFFVMIYQPPAFEGHIDGKLLPPEKLIVKGAPPKTKPDEPLQSAADLDPAVKDAVLVVIKAYDPVREAGKNPDAREAAKKTQDGMPLEILVKTPESPDTRQVASEGDSVEKGWEKMLTELKAIRQTLIPVGQDKKEAVKTIVKLMLDGNLRHKYVVKAWDVCKAAGFDTVGFIPPADMPAPGAALKKAE
jgi:biopolymer transport protein ExbD